MTEPRLMPPSEATLLRYGLTIRAWVRLAARQGSLCAVCRKLPKSGRLCIDHRHVKGWKHMPGHERAIWVRGLVCVTCNRFPLHYAMTPERLRHAADYLEAPLPFEAFRKSA